MRRLYALAKLHPAIAHTHSTHSIARFIASISLLLYLPRMPPKPTVKIASFLHVLLHSCRTLPSLCDALLRTVFSISHDVALALNAYHLTIHHSIQADLSTSRASQALRITRR